MVHDLKLYGENFDSMKADKKVREYRLYDEIKKQYQQDEFLDQSILIFEQFQQQAYKLFYYALFFYEYGASEIRLLQFPYNNHYIY